MVELAVGDPALLLVSAKTELELVNRTADLTQMCIRDSNKTIIFVKNSL